MSTRQLLIIFVPSISILVAIAIVSLIYQVEVPQLTRDAIAIAGAHPLSGVLSNLGILLWCATASVCLFSAVSLAKDSYKKIFRFLFFSALLSFYLLFDDLFQFHEDLASRYFGIHERIVYGTLAIVVLTYLVSYRRIILRTNFFLLILALGLLGFSTVMDLIPEPWLSRLGQWEFFIEDSAKWLGIVSWCSYYVHTSYHALNNHPDLPNKAIQSDAHTSHR